MELAVKIMLSGITYMPELIPKLNEYRSNLT